jgi:hypothetical protein
MKKIELLEEYGEHAGDCGMAQVVAWKLGGFPKLRWGEDTGRGSFSLKVNSGDIVRYGKKIFCGKDKRSQYVIVRKRNLSQLPVTLEQAQMYFLAEPEVAAALLTQWQYEADNHFFITEERCDYFAEAEISYSPTIGVYEPHNVSAAEEAYKECLYAWNNIVVPNSVIQHGLQYRYQIWHDWGDEGMQKSEYRHSNEPIRVGNKFKSDWIYRPSLLVSQ